MIKFILMFQLSILFSSKHLTIMVLFTIHLLLFLEEEELEILEISFLTLFILYSLIFIYTTIVFSTNDGWTSYFLTSLYIMIVGLFFISLIGSRLF